MFWGVALAWSIALHIAFCAIVVPVLPKTDFPMYNVKATYLGTFSFNPNISFMASEEWRKGAPIVFFRYIRKKGELNNLAFFKKGAEAALASYMVARLSIESGNENYNPAGVSASDLTPKASGNKILPVDKATIPAFLLQGEFKLYPNKNVLLFIPAYRPYNAYQSLLVNNMARDMYIGIIPEANHMIKGPDVEEGIKTDTR